MDLIGTAISLCDPARVRHIPEEHAMAYARYLLILERIERRLLSEKRARDGPTEEDTSASRPKRSTSHFPDLPHEFIPTKTPQQDTDSS